MSVNFNRTKGKRFNDSKFFKVKVVYDDDPYWDEGIAFYPSYNPGFKNPNKRLLSYQIRQYRTWKYNRKTQWK